MPRNLKHIRHQGEADRIICRRAKSSQRPYCPNMYHEHGNPGIFFGFGEGGEFKLPQGYRKKFILTGYLNGFLVAGNLKIRQLTYPFNFHSGMDQ